MPVMDGYTATKEIRKWEKENRASSTPIVALTAHVFKEDIDKSLASGCNSHLTKPIKKGDLMTQLLPMLIQEGKMDENNKLIVKIDQDLEDLISQFMENTRKDISSIGDALAKNDLETIRRIGHSMKSYGSGYGFDYISIMGKAIEAAAVKRRICLHQTGS